MTIKFLPPDPGPLWVLIVVLIAAAVKFYRARREHTWLAFADGMARLGLAAFYLTTYLAALSGMTSGSDQWRALVRLGLLILFAIEAFPYVLYLIKGRK